MIAIMKKAKILLITLILLVNGIGLHAEDKSTQPFRDVLLYNFTPAEDSDKNEKKYQYYSTIIPETISKSLKKHGNYRIVREQGSLPISGGINSSEREKNLNKLGELASLHKSPFIISGRYSITGRTLNLQISLFNAPGKDLKIIEHSSDETGAQLQKTTDTISIELDQEITAFESKNSKFVGESPFIGLYTPFSLMTVGLDGGRLYFTGDFKDIFNNKSFISPYVNFDLTESFSITARLLYFQTDNYDKYTTYGQQVQFLSGSLSLCYRIRLIGDLGIALSIGGGATRSTYVIYPVSGGGQPFDNSFETNKSFDMNADASAYIVYDFLPISIRGGVAGKRIYFSEKAMDMALFFGGIGFHF